MPGIFVSYRRDDAAGWAGRLSADLREGLHGAAVFMDIDAIPPGVPYDDYIAQAVGSCDVLIALIGPRWLTVTDKAGRRRLDDPSDLTRLEILAALKRSIRVIPALVGGAEMPLADELPDALKPLARRQAYELADHRWNEDCARLVRVLKPIVGGRPSTGRRLLVGAGALLVLLAAGVGVKLLLDRPTPQPTPAPTTTTTTSTTTIPTTTTTTLPTTVPTTVPTTTTTVPTSMPPGPRIALTPAELDFGSAPIGGNLVAKRFLVRNLTDTPLVLAYVVRSEKPSEFPVTKSDCDPQLTGRITLTAEGCSIVLEFVPARPGRRDAVAQLVILDSLKEVHRVSLTGTGLAAEPKGDETAAVKAEGRCTRLSATRYDVEVWGVVGGPADATLAVEIQMPSKVPPNVTFHDHDCGAWRSVSEGRSICVRAGAPTASTRWRYRSSIVTKDVPAVATVFVWSKKQKGERASVPLTCSGKP